MTIQIPKSRQPIPQHAQKVFDGELFEIWQWPQTMFDGSIATFEKAKRKQMSIGVIPITADGKIIITEQEQPGIEKFLSFAGGMADTEEDPEMTAKRELLEETGMIADSITLWFATQPATKIEWPLFIFIAHNCTKVQEKMLDAGEKISIKEVDFDGFLEVAKLPEFRDKEIALRLFQATGKEGGLDEIKRIFIL